MILIQFLVFLYASSVFAQSSVDCSSPLMFRADRDVGDIMTSEEASSLKNILSKYNLLNDAAKYNLEYNDEYSVAIGKYQAMNDLLRTGYMGPLTRLKLNNICSGSVTKLTVVGPNGNEEKKVGENMTVSWKAQGVITGKIAISAYSYVTMVTTNIATVPVAQSSYTWKINVPVGKYKIQINYVDSQGKLQKNISDLSDEYFKVISATVKPEPSINIASPINGALYETGSELKLIWSTSNFDNNISNLSANLIIIDEIQERAIVLSSSLINDGQETFKIPNTGNGKYWIQIKADVTGKNVPVKGYSGVFRISNPAPVIANDLAISKTEVVPDSTSGKYKSWLTFKGATAESKISSWKIKFGCISGIVVSSKEGSFCEERIVASNIYQYNGEMAKEFSFTNTTGSAQTITVVATAVGVSGSILGNTDDSITIPSIQIEESSIEISSISSSNQSLNISSTEETSNVVLGQFVFKSKNVDSYLEHVFVRVNTGKTPVADIIKNMILESNGKIYPMDILENADAVFVDMRIPLPANATVPIVIKGSIAKDNGKLNGQSISLSVIVAANNAIYNRVYVHDSYGRDIKVPEGTHTSFTTTLVGSSGLLQDGSEQPKESPVIDVSASIFNIIEKLMKF